MKPDVEAFFTNPMELARRCLASFTQATQKMQAVSDFQNGHRQRLMEHTRSELRALQQEGAQQQPAGGALPAAGEALSAAGAAAGRDTGAAQSSELAGLPERHGELAAGQSGLTSGGGSALLQPVHGRGAPLPAVRADGRRRRLPADGHQSAADGAETDLAPR